MNQIILKQYLLDHQLDAIVQGCRENDLHYQEKLYKLCYPDMIKICYRYAGDYDGAGSIFNNAMLKVFTHIKNYKEEGKLMGWIKTIVTRSAIDFVKKQHHFKELPPDGHLNEDYAIPATVFDIISARDIQQIISQLPKATAVVFNLFVYDGFTHKQIGEMLGISDGTSKWHVNEGRRLLKNKLEYFTNKQRKNEQ